MKASKSLKRWMAIGLAALLLLGLFGCAGAAAHSEDAPVQAEPVAEAPAKPQAPNVPLGVGARPPVRAEQAKSAPIKAQVINLLDFAGAVTVVSGGIEMPAYSGMRLSAGDRLATGGKANATLDLNNGGLVRVEANSELEITQSNTDYIEVSLLSGSIINSIDKSAGKFAVKANNVTMGVLGTVFRVSLRDGNSAKIDLYEGRVRVTITWSGQDHIFDLGEGLSFDATDEAIGNSIQNNELDTTELGLTDLSDGELDWLIQEVAKRAAADPASQLTQLLTELLDESARRAEPPQDDPDDTGTGTPDPLPDPPAPKLGSVQPALSGLGGALLTLTWSVPPETKPYICGYYWDISDLMPGGDVFKILFGGNWYAALNTTPDTGGKSYSVEVDTPQEYAVDGMTLDIRLFTAEVDESGDYGVYDSSTVTVSDKTPDFSFADGVVSVDPVAPDSVTYYTDSDDLPDGQVEIPANEAETTISDTAQEDVLSVGDVPVLPEGNEDGVAVPSSATDVNLYFPARVEGG